MSGAYSEGAFGKAFLDDIVNWISGYFTISDIFSDQEIKDWLEDCASDYGYVKEDEQ